MLNLKSVPAIGPAVATPGGVGDDGRLPARLTLRIVYVQLHGPHVTLLNQNKTVQQLTRINTRQKERTSFTFGKREKKVKIRRRNAVKHV